MSNRLIAGLCAATLLVALPVAAKKRQVEDYADTIGEFKSIGVVAPFFESAVGYAVFPTIGEGALVVGGSHGKGQVYQGGSVIGFSSISDISLGFQAGGQAYSQVVFFQNEDALKEFTSGKFEFSASASAIAVQATASAETGTEKTGATASATKTGEKSTANATYQGGIAVFTMAKGGMMASASIAGQKYSYKPVTQEKD